MSIFPQLRHTQFVTHLFLRKPCTVYSPEVTFALLSSLLPTLIDMLLNLVGNVTAVVVYKEDIVACLHLQFAELLALTSFLDVCQFFYTTVQLSP